METPSLIISIQPGGDSSHPPDGSVEHAVALACEELTAYDGDRSEVRVYANGTYSIRRFNIAETFHGKQGASERPPKGDS